LAEGVEGAADLAFDAVARTLECTKTRRRLSTGLFFFGPDRVMVSSMTCHDPRLSAALPTSRPTT
jgi:hypothetical protein